VASPDIRRREPRAAGAVDNGDGLLIARRGGSPSRGFRRRIGSVGAPCGFSAAGVAGQRDDCAIGSPRADIVEDGEAAKVTRNGPAEPQSPGFGNGSGIGAPAPSLLSERPAQIVGPSLTWSSPNRGPTIPRQGQGRGRCASQSPFRRPPEAIRTIKQKGRPTAAPVAKVVQLGLDQFAALLGDCRRTLVSGGRRGGVDLDAVADAAAIFRLCVLGIRRRRIANRLLVASTSDGRAASFALGSVRGLQLVGHILRTSISGTMLWPGSICPMA